MILALVLALCVSALGACLAEQPEKPLLGKLTKLAVGEELLNAKVEEGAIELALFSGFKFFDNYNSMIAALESGSVRALNIDEYMIGDLLYVVRADSPLVAD